MNFRIQIQVVACLLSMGLGSYSHAATDVTADISTDQLWTTLGNPYMVSGTIEINNDAVLTIESGVLVQFSDGSSLVVGNAGAGGSIRAMGSSGAPVVFESSELPLPQPGDWDGLVFNDTASNTSILDNCEFRHAGKNGADVIRIVGSSPTLRDVSIADVGGGGIHVDGTDATPRMAGELEYAGSGYLLDLAPTANGTQFVAVSLSSTQDLMRASANAWAGFFNSGSSVAAGSVGKNAEILSAGGDLTETTTWSATSGVVRVTLEGTLKVQGPDRPILVIGEGMLVEMGGSVRLVIGESESGGLVVNGSPGSPVQFLGVDATHAAGVILDGETLPGASSIQWMSMSHCGSASGGGLVIDGCYAEVDELIVTDSAGPGLFLKNTGAMLSAVTFADFTGIGIKVGIGCQAAMIGQSGLEPASFVHGTPGSGQVGIELRSSILIEGLEVTGVGSIVDTNRTASKTQFVGCECTVEPQGSLGVGLPEFWAGFHSGVEIHATDDFGFECNSTLAGGPPARPDGSTYGFGKERIITTSTWGHPNQDVVVDVFGDIVIGGEGVPGLNMLPGVTMRMDTSSDIQVEENGMISMVGLATRPIVVLPMQSRWGYLRTGGGNATGWLGSPLVEFEHCQLLDSSTDSALDIRGGQPILRSVSIRQSSGAPPGVAALRLRGASADIESLQVLGVAPGCTGVMLDDDHGTTIAGQSIIDASAGLHGLLLEDSYPDISGLTVLGSQESAIVATGDLQYEPISGVVIAASCGSSYIGVDKPCVAKAPPAFWASFLNGTPDIQVAQWDQWVAGGIQASSTTWGGNSGLDRVILEGKVVVESEIGGNESPLLTILPGTSIELRSAAEIRIGPQDSPGFLHVAPPSALVAAGTPLDPIVFSHVGASTLNTIEFGPGTSSADSVLQDVRIDRAGSGTIAVSGGFAVEIRGCTPDIQAVEVLNGSGGAVYVSGLSEDMFLDLDELTVSQCDQGVVVESELGSVSVRNSVFDTIDGLDCAAIETISLGLPNALHLVESCIAMDSTNGLLIGNGSALAIVSSTFTGWADSAITASPGALPTILDPTFDGNGRFLDVPAYSLYSLGQEWNTVSLHLANPVSAVDHIGISGGTIEGETILRNLIGTSPGGDVSIPYRILAGQPIYSAALHVESGVSLQLEGGAGFPQPTGGARLLVAGTTENPVTFESTGSIQGTVEASSGSVIENTLILGGGGPALQLFGRARLVNVEVDGAAGDGIALEPGSLGECFLVGCTLINNGGDGIDATNASILNVADSTMSGNDGACITLGAGTNAHVRHSDLIAGSSGVSMGGQGGASQAAEFCYWGHSTGPNVVGAYPQGSGGAIGISSVDANPWHSSTTVGFGLKDVSVGPQLFDPALGSPVRINASISEAASWSLTVEDSGGTPVHSARGSGDSVQESWAGTSQPLGFYYMELRAADPGGGADSVVQGRLEIGTLPALAGEITTPVEHSFLSSNRNYSFVGSAHGANFASYKVFWAPGGQPNPTDFVEVHSSSSRISGGELANFAVPSEETSGVAVDAPHVTIRLEVTGVNSELVVVDRVFRFFSITDMAAYPRVFSPAAQGGMHQDYCTISSRTTWPAIWILAVSSIPHSSGPNNPHISMLYFTIRGSQAMEYRWDGLSQFTGEVVPDGGCVVTVFAIPLEGSSPTVRATDDGLEIDSGAFPIRFEAPVQGEVLVNSPSLSLESHMEEGVPFTVRLEALVGGLWHHVGNVEDTDFSLGGFPRVATYSAWDTTGVPNGPTVLRATMHTARGSTFVREIAVTIANLRVIPDARLLDPLVGGAFVSFQVTNDLGGAQAPPITNLNFVIKEANISLEEVGRWIPTYQGASGNTVFSSSLDFSTGDVTIPWDGLVNGLPVAPGCYVVEAEVTYQGGAVAEFSEPAWGTPTLPGAFLDTSVIASASVGGVSGETSFNPLVGETLPVDFQLTEPAFITVGYGAVYGSDTDNWGAGAIKAQVFDVGAHTLQWDGQSADWVGLEHFWSADLVETGSYATYEDLLAGASMPLLFRVQATPLPDSLIQVRGDSLTVSGSTLQPGAIAPSLGQIAHLEFDVLGAVQPEVSVRVYRHVSYDPVDPIPKDLGVGEELGEHQLLLREYLNVAQDCVGRYCLDLDGKGLGSTVTGDREVFGVLIIVEDLANPGYKATHKHLLLVDF